jgi:hypothetical protein
MDFNGLSDDEVVERLSAICLEGYARTARILLYLNEVEERRIHLTTGHDSMAEFCVRRLKMSEGTAFRRLNAARLVEKFPSLLPRIERGELHLSTLMQLRPHLTKDNVDELAAAAAGKTQMQVDELLARRAPKPDVPSSIVELPKSDARRASKVQPLSESRFLVQMTVSKDVREQLERARDLMSHRNPSNDLGVVLQAALELLIPKLEKERLGKGKRPSTKPISESTPNTTPVGTQSSPAPSRKTRAKIPSDVRRKVFERDGEACTYVSPTGRPCHSRRQLEIDHITPYARGGASNLANLRVRCRAHNRLHAEESFGRDHVAHAIDSRRRKDGGNAKSVDDGASPRELPKRKDGG